MCGAFLPSRWPAATLLLGGFGMAWFYLASRSTSPSACLRTAYGLMMLAKIYLVVLIMAMAQKFFW